MNNFRIEVRRWDTVCRIVEVKTRNGAFDLWGIDVSQDISLRDSKPTAPEISMGAKSQLNMEDAVEMAQLILEATRVATLIEDMPWGFLDIPPQQKERREVAPVYVTIEPGVVTVKQ